MSGEIIRRAMFNPCFRDINQYRGRYRILMGGAGSGKSVNIAQDLLLKLIRPENKGANLLVIRKIQATHQDSTFHQFCAVAQNIFGEHWLDVIQLKQAPLRIICTNNQNEIMFRGMADIQSREQIKSIQPIQGKLCWIWCEEASELLPEDFDLLDDRLRGQLPEGLYYQITCSFNPINANHWLKKRFFDQEHADVKRSHTTYKDNRFIDKGFQKRMEWRKEYDPEGYRVYGLGEWGGMQGRIFSHYHIAEFGSLSERFDSMAYGTDFGFHHPHVTLLLGWKDGKIYVCKEWIFYEKDSHEILSALETNANKAFLMWCDSAEPDRIKMFRRYAWQARGVRKEAGSVLAQIDWIKAHDLIIHPCCEHTIAEIEQWRWKRDRSTGEWLDEPINRLDDAMAALRYGIEGWRRGSEISF